MNGGENVARKNTPKQWRQDKELDWLELKRDSQWNNLEVNYPHRPVKVPLVIGKMAIIFPITPGLNNFKGIRCIHYLSIKRILYIKRYAYDARN